MLFTIDTANKPFRFVLWLMLFAWLAVLSKFIIFKRPLGYIKNFLLHQYSWQQAKATMHKANLSPFATIKLYLNSHMREEYVISNLVGNIAGFIPLAILLPLLFRQLRNGIATACCVFLISLGFELFQLFSMLGIFDIDDLILNTFGGMIGYFLFWTISRFTTIK